MAGTRVSATSQKNAKDDKIDTLSVLSRALMSAHARSVLDIGCGEGEMVSQLANRGLHVIGIDPQEDAIAKARSKYPRLSFIVGTAENLNDISGEFDAAFFLNSLHHVPEDEMRASLLQALDRIRTAGVVIIIEPLATGSFFRAMRPVEDETAIRAKAVHTIEQLIADGEVRLIDLQRWNRVSRFSSLEEFVAYLIKADPLRQEMADANANALARAWRDNVEIRDNHALLTQPLVSWTICRRG